VNFAERSSADLAIAAAQAAYLGRVAPGHRTRRVRWSGGETQMIEIGEGPPVLMIHGGLGEAFQWGPILEPLARMRRVLAVDRPGHGLADPFDHRGVDLLELGRRFIGDVLDAERLESAALVGCSMGGLWATSFALAHPQRVSRLVLVASPAGVSRGLPLMMRLGTLPGLRTLIRRAMRRPTRDSVRGFWKQVLVTHIERAPDDLLDVSAASQARNADSWFSLIDRAFDITGMKRDLLLGERWRELAVPTTFVWGERDAFCGPAVGEAIVAGQPNMRMIKIPDAGHMPWVDDPAAVVAAIELALA
jgi:2-hydroxy-6-oxonona-2,4-dienedioate hydrolase